MYGILQVKVKQVWVIGIRMFEVEMYMTNDFPTYILNMSDVKNF